MAKTLHINPAAAKQALAMLEIQGYVKPTGSKENVDARGIFTEVFSTTNLRKAFEYAAVEVGLGVWRDPENPYYCGCDSLIVHDLRRSGVITSNSLMALWCKG